MIHNDTYVHYYGPFTCKCHGWSKITCLRTSGNHLV